MICQFKKLIFPRSVAAASDSYMIALYKPCESIVDSAGHSISEVKAVGYCLPTASNVKYDIKGKWNKSTKHGIQFEVESYEEIVVPTEEGIIAYLASGQIKSVGAKTAEKIYAMFGEKTLDILDTDPEKLLSVPGISTGKLKKIRDSYLASRAARDVVAFLVPHGVTANRAVKLYREYGKKTLDIVRTRPYQLCEMTGIGFRTADKIAMSMGFDRLSSERVEAGLLFVLTEAETKGHLCMEKEVIIDQCMKLLETPELSEEAIDTSMMLLLQEKRLTSYHGMIYRAVTSLVEQNLAIGIRNLLASERSIQSEFLEEDIMEQERDAEIILAPEQRNAVFTALNSTVSVITGGPGTGKTLVQRVILNLFRKKCPKGNIVCCAPTGRAARKMEQFSGAAATTVHKALKILAGEDGFYGEPEMLDADLVLVDETSMMDIYLAWNLFRSIPKGCQLILIGDIDQLPSVGPGAVLSEIIACGHVPVARLDRIFRQSYSSLIPTNAKLVRHGNVGLVYGKDFCFFESGDLQASADLIEDLYLQETTRYGVDNVALLTPFRQKTETGVNALNDRLRDKVNPAEEGKHEAVFGKKLFRVGDKVMQLRNREDVNNGDIGYVVEIHSDENELSLYVDYGDGRVAEYESADADMLDLAYATTIHKSQGSEYKSVIINIQCAHSVMLVRPLIYTAITRAKERVLIVGERRALCIAIKRTDTERRGTMLSTRIQEMIRT